MIKIPLQNDCFVTSLALMGVRKLGLESLDWEPEILRDNFESVFNLDKLPQKSFDKLNCGYTLIGTDSFTATIEGFLAATAVMNNHVFEEDEVPFCSLQMCAWSVWEYMNLLGDMKDLKPTETFCPEICTYIREAGRLNGISELPVWLSFAQDEKHAMPDMTGDVTVFEMYQNRQKSNVDQIRQFVKEKQAALTAELAYLQNMGILG